MAGATPQNRNNSLSVPWSDTVRFIRQLTHDLRNHLNAIELQATYINELEENPNLRSEIKRLREMISRLTSALQKLSRSLGDVKPNLIAYRASDFVDDLRKKIAQEFPDSSNEIVWNVQPNEGVLDVDPQMLQHAFIELFANAFQHDRGAGSAPKRGNRARHRLGFPKMTRALEGVSGLKASPLRCQLPLDG